MVWRHVIWGLILQFVFALMILRWDVGRAIFSCIGDKVTKRGIVQTWGRSRHVFAPPRQGRMPQNVAQGVMARM